MGVGAVLEPLVVVTLLYGGTWVNRNTQYRIWAHRLPRQKSYGSNSPWHSGDDSPDTLEAGVDSPSTDDGSLADVRRSSTSSSLLPVHQEPTWRRREVRLLGFRKQVTSPNTRVFRHRFLSRLLRKFPFLVEAWYWALIYWVYQIGRAITALTLVEGTVDVARQHALQLVHLEQILHIFVERDVQQLFLQHPFLMTWTNRIYSFIHIPGTILFLVWLYYYTTAMETRAAKTPNAPSRPRRDSNARIDDSIMTPIKPTNANAQLYQARRRTMAMCNLLAFVVFTAWPCMPPRLLSDESVEGPVGREARSYGFVDTVHGPEGESSVWTENRFCNQYAAMPSLHFGYSLLIGLTVLTIPLPSHHRRSLPLPFVRARLSVPSSARIATTFIGLAYPLIILAAIVATANHFILDAVAGAMVCGLAWAGNGVLLNLLPIEDWFLRLMRVHKPDIGGAIWGNELWSEERDEEGWGGVGKRIVV